MNGIKAFIIPFFLFHYGFFCYGHVTFVVGLFSDTGLRAGFFDVMPLQNTGFWIAAGAIFLSHLISYFVNYLGRGENERTGLATLMKRPYGRIVVMHVTIIIGAFFVLAVGNPLPALIVLVVAKTVLDLKLHHRERAAFAA